MSCSKNERPAAGRITVNAYCPGIVDTQMWVEVDRDLGAINNLGEGESMNAMAAVAKQLTSAVRRKRGTTTTIQPGSTVESDIS